MIANTIKKGDISIEEDVASAVHDFGVSKSDVTEGEVLAETVHAAVQAANEIAEELLPEVNANLAAAKALMDEADGIQEGSEADDVRDRLSQLEE
jgi:hypothetical protein